jgi:hypothetical protein
MDLVEKSPSSKKEKETTGRAEASNVETPAPPNTRGKKKKRKVNDNSEGIDKI